MLWAWVRVKPGMGKAHVIRFSPFPSEQKEVLPSPTSFYPSPIFGLRLAHSSALALAQEVMSLAPASPGFSCVCRMLHSLTKRLVGVGFWDESQAG